MATPFPKQLETGRREREYKAFVGSLETIPAMHEVSLEGKVSLGKKPEIQEREKNEKEIASPSQGVARSSAVLCLGGYIVYLAFTIN